MKKTLLISLLAAATGFASAAAIDNSVYASANGSYSVNGNSKFKGPGAGVKVGYLTNWVSNDSIELGFDFVALTAKQSATDTAKNTLNSKVNLNEYILTLGYKLSDTIADSNFSWYASVAAGVNFANATQKLAGTNAAGVQLDFSEAGANDQNLATLKVKKTAPVVKVAVGVAYNFSEQLSVYGGANVLFTKKANFYTTGQGFGTNYAQLLGQSTKSYQFAGELGLAFKF